MRLEFSTVFIESTTNTVHKYLLLRLWREKCCSVKIFNKIMKKKSLLERMTQDLPIPQVSADTMSVDNTYNHISVILQVWLLELLSALLNINQIL